MKVESHITYIAIESFEDYDVVAQAAKKYHDSVVSALLELSNRNPDNYNLWAFRICHNSEFVWTAGTDTIIATKQDILALYLGENQALAQLEQVNHKDENKKNPKQRKIITMVNFLMNV